jgi:hypothetical protein
MTTSEMTFERHFSVDELAALWGMSDDFVRRLFLHEPGVVVFFHYRPGRRVYRTLRIPESVAQRVHRRMQKIGVVGRHHPASRRWKYIPRIAASLC